MALGKSSQIERDLDHVFLKKHPWSIINKSSKLDKKYKHKAERLRAKRDPECMPYYNRYDGWCW